MGPFLASFANAEIAGGDEAEYYPVDRVQLQGETAISQMIS